MWFLYLMMGMVWLCWTVLSILVRGLFALTVLTVQFALSFRRTDMV